MNCACGFLWLEAATRGLLYEKVQTSACNLIQKETLAQVFSCKFCEIPEKNFFTEHLWAAASGWPLYYPIYVVLTVSS